MPSSPAATYKKALPPAKHRARLGDTPTGQAHKRQPHPQPAVEAVVPTGKRRLLDAAAIEFSERGYEGASVLSIARRAGVKQPLLNYHFRNKEGVWRAVIEEGYQEMVLVQQALDDDPSGASPLERLKSLLRSFALINVHRPSVHAIMQKEMMFESSRLDWLVDTYMAPFNRRLGALIEECMAQGFFRRIPVQHASVMLTGVLVSYFIACELPERMYGRRLKAANAALVYFENAVDALLSGMLARPNSAPARQGDHVRAGSSRLQTRRPRG